MLIAVDSPASSLPLFDCCIGGEVAMAAGKTGHIISRTYRDTSCQNSRFLLSLASSCSFEILIDGCLISDVGFVG